MNEKDMYLPCHIVADNSENEVIPRYIVLDDRCIEIVRWHIDVLDAVIDEYKELPSQGHVGFRVEDFDKGP